MKRASLPAILLVFAFGLCLESRAEINSSGILGFQTWKQSRVDEAKSLIEKLQAAGVDAKKGPQDPARRKLQQAQLNLEINEELGVTDYFTLYVSQLKDRSSFVDAAKKLSDEETADLMMAYQKVIMTAPQGTAEPSLPLLAAPSPQGKPTRLRD